MSVLRIRRIARPLVVECHHAGLNLTVLVKVMRLALFGGTSSREAKARGLILRPISGKTGCTCLVSAPC
jgi:hypothetical protein